MGRCIYFVLTLCVCISQMMAGDDFGACLELFKTENMEMKCCERIELLSHIANGCGDIDRTKWTCDDAKCVLGKYDILDTDGEVDEKKVKELLDKVGEEEPKDKTMAERVRRECLDGQYKMFETDACPAINFQICAYVNSLVECPSWKRNPNCVDIADYAKQCKAVLDQK